jgi:hypothetical protein
MYLTVPPQPDCVTTWREAVRALDARPGHCDYNVIMAVADPIANATPDDPRIAVVNEFLLGYDKSIETVANTIFPRGLYRRYGAPAFFEVFSSKILAKVRRNERWSGYYFERMIQHPTLDQSTFNQLWDIVLRIRDPQVRALNKFEMVLFDPNRDIDNSPYGGQCLSFLSFKLVPGTIQRLALTAIYRNHFYIEKLLGNLIGLGRLMEFVATESQIEIGSLTVLSTHAVIDGPGGARRSDIHNMLLKYDQAAEAAGVPQPSVNGSSSVIAGASSSIIP